MPENKRTVSHSQPFAVGDLEEFLRQVDEDPNIAVSEEEVNGRNMVRLWAETGQWPTTTNLVDLISPHLEEGEVAILQTTSIHSKNDSEMKMLAISAEGEFLETDSRTWAEQAINSLGGRRADLSDEPLENDDAGDDDVEEDVE